MPESGKKCLFLSVAAGWGWAGSVPRVHPSLPTSVRILHPFVWGLSPKIPIFPPRCRLPMWRAQSGAHVCASASHRTLPRGRKSLGLRIAPAGAQEGVPRERVARAGGSCPSSRVGASLRPHRVPGMGCCQDGPLHLLTSPSGPSTGIPLKSKPLAFCASYSCEILQEGKIIPPRIPVGLCHRPPFPAGRESTGCHGAQVCPWARLVAWPCYLGFPSVLQPLPANLELGGDGTTEGTWAQRDRPRWEG